MLSYPNGATEEVLLAGVPREGEQIRLKHGRPESPSLMVDTVVWMEGGNGDPTPQVLVTVHHRDR